MIILAYDKKIDGATGTNIGDLTGGGGLAAAFNGTISQAIAASASKTASTGVYVGKTYSSAKDLVRAVVYGTNDQGYVSGANPSVALYLYGKNGVAPANKNDGTLLTLNPGFTDTANESGTPREIVAGGSPPASDYYLHQWVTIEQGGGAATMAAAEVIFYEVWGPDDYVDDLPLIGYHNVVSVSNITGTSQEPDYPLTNLANPSTALKWKADTTDSPITATVNIVVDVTGLGATDYIGFAGHNFGSSGASVLVEGQVGTGGYVTIVAATAVDDDSPLVIRYPSQSLDDIRITITVGADAPEAAVLYIGEMLVLEQGIQPDHVPLPYARQDEVVTGRSESGQFLGRVRTGGFLESTASIANLSQAWVISDLIPFLQTASEEPFFWAPRPSTNPEWVSFAWLMNDPQPSLDVDGYIAVDLQMQGVST